MARHYTETEMIDLIRLTLTRYKFKAQWARDHGCSQGFLTLILKGKRTLSTKLAASMGYKKITCYVKESRHGHSDPL